MGGMQVNEFGQCPRQLFQAPHPPRLASPSERGNGAPPAATCLCVSFPTIIQSHSASVDPVNCQNQELVCTTGLA